MLFLAYACNIAVLVCFIMTLVQMFTKAGPLHGILGIISCGIWAFIWGWMNTARTGQKNIMIIWTIAWILGTIIGWRAGMFAMSTAEVAIVGV